MAASWAFPPSPRTSAPASLPSRCGLAITPAVKTRSGYRARGQKLDGAGLDLEQRRQHARVFAVDVDTPRPGRPDLNAVAVHDGDLRVVVVQVPALADQGQAAQRFDLAAVAD